jgi:cysteinyl-tRNA synthetase
MRWPSPWGEGFPGWHLECSAMSGKYLGETFDIHGGGMDLLFPHHECEIAQSQGANKKDPVRYWLHNNMITINGQKMGKSLGNFITLNEFFSGSHKLLEQAYSPMTVRFFILQAHYRSTLDFSNEALKAAQKGYRKLVNGLRTLNQLVYTEDKSLFNEKLNKEIQDACRECYDGMNDDFNSAVSIAALFSLLTKINSFKNGVLNISALSPGTFNDLKNTYTVFFLDILGLTEEKPSGPRLLEELMNAVLDSYRSAKQNKDYATVDKIRSQMKKEGIQLKDTKTGVEWSYEE